MDSSSSSDLDNTNSILYKMYAYSKQGILKIKNNLDVIYGTNSEQKKLNMNLLYKHISRFFDELVLESDKDKNAIIKNIENLLSEKEILETELNTHIVIKSQNNDMPLIALQINIETALQDYRNIKLEYMNELHKLQEEEKQLCEILNMKPKYSEFKATPCIAQLECIKDYLVDLKNTKNKRWATFLKQKSNVESIFRALGDIPILQFDKMVLGDPNQFQLSGSNMHALQQLLNRLNDQVENQKCIAMELRTKLNSLWDLLKIDMSYRVNFVNSKKGYDKNVIDQLKMEISKCEKLKKKNIALCIENLRGEINYLWNKCYFGEKQKKECHVYFMEKSINKEYNEYLIELLEIEVDQLKKFYADNSSIYYLIEERNHLWKKMLMIQKLTNDPTRYWQNRGGQLLKEEKERKIIQKELPRVEQELKSLLHSFEEQNGKSFLYYDEKLIHFIDNQWDEMKSSREFLQPTKTGVKPQTPLLTTPCSRKNIVTQTKNQTCRFTTNGNKSYSARQFVERNNAMTIPRRELTHQNNNAGTLVQLTSTPFNNPKLTSTPQSPTFDENGLAGSYKAFQKHQKFKKRLLFTSELREQNTKQPQRPLMETPIKRSQIPISTKSKTTPNTRYFTPSIKTLKNNVN
ncbi:Hypothetical protein CINCED_3A018181 [Cinara cedri]|uniref:Protein regulator of cytokinesis 1 n=1 Tax=Cinara cedri TaxID=506608 RepID=A0A5E4NM01_9HEMI|nr:Hypothetical protein CINCED_3A018181 [Cinara cedri]